MKKTKNKAVLRIKNGLFFPADFTKLHPRTAIYVHKGVIIDLDKLGNSITS
jgi:hypothetical protein